MSDAEDTFLDGLRGCARDFARGAAGALEARDIRDIPDEDRAAALALARLVGSGLLGYVVPAACGGADVTPLAERERVSVRVLCAIREALAFHSGMLDVVFVEQGLGSYPVALGGSEPLRAALLGAVTRGESIAAFALTEDGAGSDLAGVALEASERDDGSFVLRGHKTYITNAGIADFYTVLARTEGRPGDADGLTMFYVPATAPGLTVERFEVTAPHPIGRVEFDGVVVPSSALLGRRGGGLELAVATLNTFRTSVAAAAVGFARRALHESVRHLEARQQFGRALSSFQGLRFDLAEMDTRLRAAELLVAEAALRVDRGLPARAEIARAKLYATETASWVCDRAVQHHGGSGVRRGSIVEALWRDVRALRIYEGTSEVQKLILAKELLQASRSQTSVGLPRVN